MEKTKLKVIEILCKYTFDNKVWQNTPENPKIVDDLKIHSARILDVVLDIEEAFGIEIETKVLQKILTLNDLINVIESKI